jgi:hypothetical protein
MAMNIEFPPLLILACLKIYFMGVYPLLLSFLYEKFILNLKLNKVIAIAMTP